MRDIYRYYTDYEDDMYLFKISLKDLALEIEIFVERAQSQQIGPFVQLASLKRHSFIFTLRISYFYYFVEI